MLKHAIAIAAVAAMTVPTLAQDDGDEYYIVRGPDKKCVVVETKPDDEDVIVIGDKAFVTKEEADSQIEVLCKDDLD